MKPRDIQIIGPRTCTVPVELAQCPTLGSEAKAVYLAAMSLGTENVPVWAIRACLKAGRDSIQKALKDLRDHFWADYEIKRGSDGRYTTSYTFYTDRSFCPRFPEAAHNTSKEIQTPLPVPENQAPVKSPVHGKSVEDWRKALEEQGLKPRRSGDGYVALCPLHNDTQPSLTFRPGLRTAVIARCHGCGARFEELSACLFPAQKHTSDIRTYTYTDDRSQPVYRMLRLPGKRFKCEHLFDGQWKPRLPRSTPRYPYRLPQLIRAIREGQTIYLVEGEKDADTLHERGYVATTNVLGAGKWSSELNRWFIGARVVIIADKDAPGMAHARTVAQALSAHAKEVTICIAAGGPEIKDASDHFAHGFRIADFVKIDIDEYQLEAA